MSPPKYSRTLAEHIPSARLVRVAEAGHMVMLEPTAQLKVVESISQFPEDDQGHRRYEDGSLSAARRSWSGGAPC